MQQRELRLSKKHKPIKWADLEHAHMSLKLWECFATYIGKCTKNKYRLKFPPGNKTASKKAVMNRKVPTTDTTKKYISQCHSINE